MYTLYAVIDAEPDEVLSINAPWLTVISIAEALLEKFPEGTIFEILLNETGVVLAKLKK